MSLLFILILVSTKTVYSQSFSNWQQLSGLPNIIASNFGYSYENHIYSLGGATNSVPSIGIYSSISPNGQPTSWLSVSSVPSPRFLHSGSHKGSFVYLLGGADVSSHNLNSVIVGKIENTGNILTWQPVTFLPQALSLGSSVIVGDHIYFAGGDTGTSNSPSTSIQDIYMNTANPDGTLGPSWSIAGQLPAKMLAFGMVAIDDYFYIIGGRRTDGESSNGVSAKVQRAPIDSSGNIGAWENLPSLPKPSWRAGVTYIGDTVVVAGGHNYTNGFLRDVYYATLDSDGKITEWKLGPSMANSNCCGPLVAWNNFVYFLGGTVNGSYSNQVIKSEITFPQKTKLIIIKHVVNDNGGTKSASDFKLNITANNPSQVSVAGTENPGAEITLDPGEYSVDETDPEGYIKSLSQDCSGTINAGETKTCTVTNDDIRKVVLIPGLGASWNAKAMLFCGDADENGWNIMPLAEQYYEPIINSLAAAGKEVVPFYYDWRDAVQNNSQKLSEFLPNEKVDLVSHSMGGLISRGLIQNIGNTNINSVYLVGTPNEGSINAFPTWQWGDVWSDNFIYKIALTLYLKGCGVKNNSNEVETIHQIFPSIGDLLPTYNDYVRSKNGEVVPGLPENIWLHDLNNQKLPDIKIGTLSGNGFDTLESITVKDLTSQRATGKNKISEGDGTVLLSSSKIEGIDSDEIKMSHSDLIASSSGIAKVFDFLGINQPQTISSNFLQPESALIVVGYPSEFWITDQNGNTHKDNKGMVSFINPKPGSFKLSMMPKSNETVLAVAQFLPNGDIKFKEYKFKGMGPKIYNFEFDLQNPKDDILK